MSCETPKGYTTASMSFKLVLILFCVCFIFQKDGDIDFLTHYKLVDPNRLDSYARAFVVEDADLDTVIDSRVSYNFWVSINGLLEMGQGAYDWSESLFHYQGSR